MLQPGQSQLMLGQPVATGALTLLPVSPPSLGPLVRTANHAPSIAAPWAVGERVGRQGQSDGDGSECGGETAVDDRGTAFYEELIRAAILAPSPDNNQPWWFSVKDGKFLIHPDHERALPSDVDSMFMMMALGAAAENVRIAARQMNYEAQIRAGATDDSGAAHVELIFSAGAVADPLYTQLQRRCTSRRWYSRCPITIARLQAVSDAAAGFHGIRVHWICDRPAIRRLSCLVAASDRIRLEHRPFHEELYRQLRFTREEAERTRDGLDLRTLELPPGGATLLQWLSQWNRMRIGNQLGLSRFLSLPSAAACWFSGAVAVITVARRSVQHYLDGGRTFQRLWLAAQQHGLSVQPMGSLPIFMSHVDAGRGGLSAGHQRRIRQLGRRLVELVGLPSDQWVVMLCRCGYAAPPLNRALRRAAEIQKA